MTRKMLSTAMLLLTACWQAHAQSASPGVWRCGPDGRSYESQPCKDGRAIDLPGPRPETDVRAAQRAALAEQRLAAQLRQERLAREQQPQGRAATPAQVKPRQDRPPATAQASALTPSRQALGPEAVGTSPKAARMSRQTPD